LQVPDVGMTDGKVGYGRTGCFKATKEKVIADKALVYLSVHE